MKEVTFLDLSKVHGGQPTYAEPAPVGVIAGGNPDNFAAYVSINLPVTDSIYVSPHVVVDHTGDFHKPGIQVTWVIP